MINPFPNSSSKSRRKRTADTVPSALRNWDDLRANLKDAVQAYFFDAPIPERVRLHLVRNGSNCSPRSQQAAEKDSFAFPEPPCVSMRTIRS